MVRIPHFALHISYFPFQISYFKFHISHFILPISNFIFHISNFIFHIPHFALPISYFKLHISYFALHISYFKLLISNFKPRTPHFIFHTSQFLIPYFKQTPKPHAHALAQADKIREARIAAEIQRKAKDFAALVRKPTTAFEAGDLYLQGPFRAPADAFGESQDIAQQELLQKLQAFDFGAERLETLIVVLIEGLPVFEGILELPLPALHVEVVEVDVLDLKRLLPVPDAQGQVPALEQIVDVIGAFVEADDARLLEQRLVLYERVTIDAAAVRGMVVEEGRLPGGGFDDRSPETGGFPGQDRVGECHLEIAYLWHIGVFIGSGNALAQQLPQAGHTGYWGAQTAAVFCSQVILRLLSLIVTQLYIFFCGTIYHLGISIGDIQNEIPYFHALSIKY